MSAQLRNPRRLLGAGAAILAISLAPHCARALDILGSLNLVESVPDYDPSAGGSWLAQIARANGFPKKAYAPPAELIDPYSKASLGPQTAYALVKGVHLANAPQVTAACQAIVDKLLKNWGGPVPDVRVLITSNADYGASANYTGNIFVDIGTFNRYSDGHVGSEDELALMLGHELGHLLLMHERRRQVLQHATEMLGTAASVASSVALVRNTHVVGHNVQIQADQTMYMHSVIGGLASTMLVGDIFTPSWGRDREEEADRIGLDLARASGYLVTDSVMSDFINKQTQEAARRSERMKSLQAASSLMVLSVDVGAAANSQGGGIASLMAKLGGIAVIDKIMGALSDENREHPDPALRLKDLQTYANAVYGTAPPMENGKRAKLHTETVNRILADGAVQGLIKSTVTASHIATALTVRLAAVAQDPSANKSTGTQSGALSSTQAAQPDMKDKSAQPKNAAPASTAGAAALSPLPSPCTGTDALLPPSPPSLAASERINLSFPTDGEPFTWRVRGDWQEVSPGCANRAAADYDRSAATGYATIEILHKIAASYAQTHDAGLVTRTYTRYVTLIGTDQDFPDLAVAAAMARNDPTMAEEKAADCLAYQHRAFYSTCSSLLGYDPTKEGASAKTDEGRKAFIAKASKSAVQDFFNNSLFGGD